MSEAEKEIINWCQGLNTYYTGNDETYKFPAICKKIVSQSNPALQFDVNEYPVVDENNLAIENGPSWLSNQISIMAGLPILPSSDTIMLNAMRYCCTVNNNIKKKEDLLKAKQDFEISSKRVEVTREPAANISRYGTHFAFGKPLRFSTIPFLIAISIFFLVISLGILMEVGGTRISISSSGPSFFSQFIETFTSSWSQTESSFKIGLIAISVLVGAVGYYGADKLREYMQTQNPPATQK